MSALLPETPSNPACRFTSRLSSGGLIPFSCSRYSNTPGSRSPERVPIIRPPVGVKPIVVSIEMPPYTAARLAPLPR